MKLNAAAYKAIGDYADENNLIPQLSNPVEGLIWFKSRLTGETSQVGLQEILNRAKPSNNNKWRRY